MGIDFTENKHGNLALSGIYLWRSARHFAFAAGDLAALIHERVIKRYPLAVIAVVILISVVCSIVQVGKARAERDSIAEQLYIANQKIERMEECQ